MLYVFVRKKCYMLNVFDLVETLDQTIQYFEHKLFVFKRTSFFS